MDISLHQDLPFRNIAVLGGGSWATAVVKILSEKDVNINWWMRNQQDINHIRQFHHNPRYLSSVELNLQRVHPEKDLKQVLAHSDLVILAVPAAFIPAALEGIDVGLIKDKFLVSTIKGMIPEENMLVTEWMEKKFGISDERIAVIAGPCHAEEVAMEKQSYLTLASHHHDFGAAMARQLRCRFINTHTIRDVYGVEYCAVLKNIVAIASGIARGLNYGDNFQAVLVSNAMQEIKRFLKSAYKLKRQMTSSAYLGDLLVTAYSQFSRNRTFGYMLGRGYSVKSAQMEMQMVAEGYYAVRSIYELNKKFQVEMPITHAVYHIIYEKISPAVELRILSEKLK